MDVFEAVRTVLAVHHYQGKPVPAGTVRQILEAGRLTASSQNKQPWHFIVIEDRETLQHLADVVTTGSYMAQAPLAIVVAIDRTRFAVSDGSRAIQSMILTAWAAGVGSNWTGFMGPAGVKPLLGIPDDLDVLAVLPFGYPAQPTGKGEKKRKPLNEVASRGRFGQPLA